jgi:hypothetical protein
MSDVSPENDHRTPRPLGYEVREPARPFDQRHPILWQIACLHMLLLAVVGPLLFLGGLSVVTGAIAGELTMFGHTAKGLPGQVAWLALNALVSAGSIWFVITQIIRKR